MTKEKETINATKRLVLDIPVEYHSEIKMRAAERNISMKKWVLRALKEKIQAEKQYE